MAARTRSAAQRLIDTDDPHFASVMVAPRAPSFQVPGRAGGDRRLQRLAVRRTGVDTSCFPGAQPERFLCSAGDTKSLFSFRAVRVFLGLSGASSPARRYG